METLEKKKRCRCTSSTSSTVFPFFCPWEMASGFSTSVLDIGGKLKKHHEMMETPRKMKKKAWKKTGTWSKPLKLPRTRQSPPRLKPKAEPPPGFAPLGERPGGGRRIRYRLGGSLDLPRRVRVCLPKKPPFSSPKRPPWWGQQKSAKKKIPKVLNSILGVFLGLEGFGWGFLGLGDWSLGGLVSGPDSS